MLGAAIAGFVACGADTNSGSTNGGTAGNAGTSGNAGNAGNGTTSGGASAGAGLGGSSNTGGSATKATSGEGGALASGGAAGEGAAGEGGGAGEGGAPAGDRCGGCNYNGVAPQICIYQSGGPGGGRFVCATQNPCGAAGACACIVGQGTCGSMLEGGSPGYCVCDNGLD